MKITMRPPVTRLFQYLFLATLLAGYSVNAKVIDEFNQTSLVSGYSSTANGGVIQTTNPPGQLNITPAAVAGRVSSIKKTQVNGSSPDALFTNFPTHTLEFKVNVLSIFTDGTTTNGQAVLGWAPNIGLVTGRLLTNGYSLSVGPESATIRANATVLYTTNFVTPIQNSALVLAMRMTPDVADTNNVIVKSTVYNNVSGAFTVLFEHSVTNSPGAFGMGTNGGQIALGAVNDASGAATTVRFDTLQVFDTIREVLDTFSSAPFPTNGWVNVNLQDGATNKNNGSGQLQMDGALNAIASSGTYKGDKIYKITDGTRLEQRLDVVTLGGDADNWLVLGYSPTAPFTGLNMYHMAVEPGSILAGAAISVWWRTVGGPIPGSNLRLIQTITAEGTAARIEARVEDLTVDVNDPLRVLDQYMYVDNTGVYLNFNGYFAMGVYHGGVTPGVAGTMTVDNAEVNKTLANTPPNVTLLVPANGRMFYDPAGGLSFKVTDDISLPTNGIKVTLSGVVYTNGSPGVTVTPATGSAAVRTFAFNGLALNTYYNGNITVTDNVGESNVFHCEFDTFSQTNLTVEIEDFNHTDGIFIDNGVNAYAGLIGTREIDFHNNNNGQSGTPAPADDYRVNAGAQGFEIWKLNTDVTSPQRTKYVGAADPNEYKVFTSSGGNGDWANYTRTYPPGTYKAYLRLSTAGIPPFSQFTLARVGGDTTLSNQFQFTTNLGSFIQLSDAAGDTGVDVDRTVPLVDGVGNPVVIRFAGGVETLRLTRNHQEDGINILNYMAFITTPDPGVLRPIVLNASPAPGSTSRYGPAPEGPYVSIVNQETAVTNVVALKLNGVNVAFTTNNTATGTDVAWSLLSVPAATTITNTLIFKDSQGVSITNSYTYSYPYLRATNRLVGALTTRGFSVRMVHSSVDPGNNSIATAEGQLALPTPTLGDAFETWQTNAQIINWDDNLGPGGPNAPGAAAVTYVPGLDNIASPVGSGFANNVDEFAVETLGYLYLTAGAHRFSVVSDDGFKIASGTNVSDHGGAVLAFGDGGSFGFPARSFDFLVEADGLYPLRAIWQEGGGYADFHLYSRDPNTGTDTCVNDPANPAGVVKAYFPGTPTPAVLSAAAVGGPYSIRFDASVNTGANTATVPILSDAKQFYRLGWSSGLTVTNVTKVGTNIVIKYQ